MIMQNLITAKQQFFLPVITIDLKCEFCNSWFVMHLILFYAHTDCRPLNPRTFRVCATINENILCFAVTLDVTEGRNEKSEKTRSTPPSQEFSK